MSKVFLQNKGKFKKVLKDYHVSPHAKKVLSKVEYVVFIGVAAAGRNTIISELVQRGGYQQVISDTTRPPKYRDGKLEQEGVNYYFRSEEDLLKDLVDGEFLEAELIHDQQVSGTSIRELESIAGSGDIALNEIEFGGAINVLNEKPDSIVIAILPPSFQEWQRRFSAREDISPEEYKNRIETAKNVIKLIDSDDRIHVVINHDYRAAAEHVHNIVHGKSQNAVERSDVEQVLNDFRTNIDQTLYSLS